MNNNHILILKPDNIGDVILLSGAFQHIRRLYPDAHITLAVQSHIINLFELCPYIDACVSVDHLTWWGNIKKYNFPFKSRMEKLVQGANALWNIFFKEFGVIIFPVKSPSLDHLKIIKLLQPNTVFGIIGCNLCAPETGYPRLLQPKMLFTHALDVSKADAWQHEIVTNLDYLRFIGCHVTSVDDIKPQFWLANSEKNYLDYVIGSGKKVIGLFPGASFEGRCWEASNYCNLAYLLGHNAIYVIFGDLAGKDLSERVVRYLQNSGVDAEILNLTGQTSLREMVKAISSCDILISMETSGLHVGIAVEIPTVGIVGGGHYGRFVPWGDPSIHIFLTQKIGCFHCNWRCSNGFECIKGVSPNAVASAVQTILGRSRD